MTEEKPLTREDILKLIEEHGGPEGLDLSGKKFKEEIDLSDLDLRGAHLEYAELKEANLSCAKFGLPEEPSHMKAHLDETDLRGANLFRTDFTGCFLYGTKLEGALIRGAELIGKANIAEADWGNFVIGEEQKGDFRDAERQYRYLKQWYIQEGIQDVAGEFSFREREARRKAQKWLLNPLPRVWSKFLALLFGYGERPLRLSIWALAIVVGLAGIYSASTLSCLDSLYYSISSFTALGYGAWVPHVGGYVKVIGAFEAFIGILMIVLFSVTFTKKLAR